VRALTGVGLKIERLAARTQGGLSDEDRRPWSSAEYDRRQAEAILAARASTSG